MTEIVIFACDWNCDLRVLLQIRRATVWIWVAVWIEWMELPASQYLQSFNIYPFFSARFFMLQSFLFVFLSPTSLLFSCSESNPCTHTQAVVFQKCDGDGAQYNHYKSWSCLGERMESTVVSCWCKHVNACDIIKSPSQNILLVCYPQIPGECQGLLPPPPLVEMREWLGVMHKLLLVEWRFLLFLVLFSSFLFPPPPPEMREWL